MTCALNQDFNSNYKSLVVSLEKDEEEQVKGLTQSKLCGMYLNTLPSEFNFIVRLNMREAEKDLKKIQQGVDRYAISEEIKLRVGMDLLYSEEGSDRQTKRLSQRKIHPRNPEVTVPGR